MELIKGKKTKAGSVKIQGLNLLIDDSDPDIVELKRSLELCMALDEFRSLWFAGEPINDEQIIHLPLKVKDLQILFIAINDHTDELIGEINRDIVAQEKYDKKQKKWLNELS